MRILNLYSGIGGNRKLWGDEHEITAVENDVEIASIYNNFFPKDKLVINDAHEFLLDNYKNFDFIWSSPPCQSHSQIRFNLGVRNRGTKPIYPDMKLYEEILFLKWNFKGNYVVENTRSYYEPLILPQYVGSHYFWANFHITKFDIGNRNHRNGTVESLQGRKGFNLDSFDITNKRQILRNCVEPELGKHVLDCALKKELKLL